MSLEFDKKLNKRLTKVFYLDNCSTGQRLSVVERGIRSAGSLTFFENLP